MKQIHVTLSLFFLLLGSLLGQTQHGKVPAGNMKPQLKFSGKLTDLGGNPLSGVVGVRFLVYKDETGGAPVWSERQNVRADATGHYMALLGSATVEGIPLTLFRSTKICWISTQTPGQEESSRARYVLNGAGLTADYTGQYSADWAGYAVTGTEFTFATGSWHVPGVSCTKTPNDFSKVWVGIDGFTPTKGTPNGTLEQIGTASICAGTNGTTPTYFAWYELYPDGSVVIPTVTVTDGDVIGAYVHYWTLSDPFLHLQYQYWTLWLEDYTTGAVYSGTFPYNSTQQRSTAEWIVERPCCDNNGIDEPLADFGTVNFGGYLTGIAGTNYAEDISFGGNIGQFPSGSVYELTMSYPENSTGMVLAVPGALEGEGGSTLGSFQVSWKATGP